MDVFDLIVEITSWAIIGIGAFGFLSLIFAIVVLLVTDCLDRPVIRGDDDD